jgi:anhydro-N-acetylmuramic acid kinase
MRALGMMSGTSLDGIDVAWIETDGEALQALGPARTYAYTAEERALLAAALADGRHLATREERPGRLGVAEDLVTRCHLEAASAFCAETGTAPRSIDVIGFHGQTVLHDPTRRLTVQIGDGDALALRIGIDVIWDMRAADVAAGGQGAPLAPAYHGAIVKRAGVALPAAVVNIGGVANVTLIGTDGNLTAFDTGPGNALLDDWTFRHTGQSYDAGGALARSGQVSEAAIARLRDHPYFAALPPKSLDRNAFSLAPVDGLSAEDGAATLVAFTARTIAMGLSLAHAQPSACFVSGGGRRNPAIMAALAAALPRTRIAAVEEIGLDGDAIEAQAFAYLAVRSLRGLPLSYPSTTGVAVPMLGGRHAKGRRLNRA